MGQLDELKERQRMKKEGLTMDNAEDNDPDNLGHGGDGGDDHDDDLFGDDDGMDIG